MDTVLKENITAIFRDNSGETTQKIVKNKEIHKLQHHTQDNT